jgi:hypothetical protein
VEVAMPTTESIETWQKVLGDWEASGLSLREFAAQRGLKVKSLEWWRWKLGALKKRDDSALLPVATMRFVPLDVVKPAATALRLRLDNAPVSLEIPTGSSSGGCGPSLTRRTGSSENHPLPPTKNPMTDAPWAPTRGAGHYADFAMV